MQRVLGAVELVVVIHGQVVVQFGLVYADACFVGPAARHVFDGVAASAKNHEWESPAFDKAHCLAMSFDRSVVRAQSVSSKTVSSALQDHSIRSEGLSDLGHDGAEDVLELLVIDKWLERHIE